VLIWFVSSLPPAVTGNPEPGSCPCTHFFGAVATLSGTSPEAMIVIASGSWSARVGSISPAPGGNVLGSTGSLQDAKEWRLRKSLVGGGALMDMGIYAIQGARYVTGEEPISVLAQEFKTDSFTFCEVEETICWQMAFPSGTVANCAATYAADIGRLFAAAERGWFKLDPAYAYGGLRAWTFDGRRESMSELRSFNQQAAQLDAIADAIRNRRPSPVPGEEGLQDLRIIEAIYRSVAAGQLVTINYERIR
jgi:predicted dehydrogenase